VALSHRWGSPQQHAKFCTYKSNIEEFKRGIDVKLLPKTFQDAVHVTRGLGLQRLWIDSLCIVQDDEDDWETESKFMERVFSSAYCTIAASCASGSSDGFLKSRPARRCVIMQASSGNAPYYVCEVIDDFHRDVDQSELNQRGWVLQERALSRRTIYFTETQSYWECGGGVRCETMTKMKK
jgi:Heterokaryon incompatibility protein (HET)